MSKVLITGGAGFIGAHVAHELLRRGDEVVVLDDFNDRYDPRLKEARINFMFKDLQTAPKVIKGDICDKELLATLFSENAFDSVVHLAAWASVQTSISNPHIYTEVNVDGTVNILEAARMHAVKNIVFASSSSVYGGSTEIPFRETANIMHPISPYAATKVAGEILCSTWHTLYHIPITCLRFFTVYGPWGRPDMAIFKFADALRTNKEIPMRGKETQRDFTYIDDIVQGVIAALDKPQGFAVFNLGEQDGVLLPRLITALEEAFHTKANVKEVPLPLGDIAKTLADISNAREKLGYHPTTSIEDGTKKFADWYTNWYVPTFEK